MGRRRGSVNGVRPVCPFDGREATLQGLCPTHRRRELRGLDMTAPIRHWGTGERAPRKTPQTPEYRRGQQLVRVYGITAAQFDEMLAKQGGGCAVCGGNNGGRTLHVDHNHATGAVRALLCAACNTALGLLREDKQVMLALIAYLESQA